MYYGYETNDIFAINKLYKGINTPKDLYFALLKCWDINTCTPRLRYKWSKDNPSVGQCAITAFIAQDIFGGDIYEMILPNGNIHCYNVVNNIIFDLTNEQFEDNKSNLSYKNNSIQDRELRMSNKEKKDRYNLLKSKLKTYTDEL